MVANQDSNSAGTGLSLPLDMSACFDRTFLVTLVLESAQSVEWPSYTTNFGLGDGKFYRPQMLLTLLTYCYATGHFGSQEVEAGIERNLTLRYLSANCRPDWNVLRRFRRLNRERIEQCLTSTLAHAWESQAADPDFKDHTDPGYLSCSLSRWTSRMVTPDFREEARQRVQLAIQSDSMALDE
jgi:hypothetical protein